MGRTLIHQLNERYRQQWFRAEHLWPSQFSHGGDEDAHQLIRFVVEGPHLRL